MTKTLLQSRDWEKLQKDLGKVTFFEENADFSYLATLEKTPLGNYLYLPYGPVYESKAGFKNAVKSLKTLALKNHAIFIRIEPRDAKNAEILRNKAKIEGLLARKTTDLNPKETWVLDLNNEPKNIVPSRLLRYYKAREKNHLEITTSKNPDDIHFLVELQKKLASSKKINIFSESYLKTELAQDFATLYLVKDTENNKIAAAGLVFDYEGTRYNLQGAQDENYRRLHATGILTIQLILDAYEKGLGTFDFWGIAPENAPKNHPWAGFTAFKKTFAGTELDFKGTYDLILDTKKYRLYKALRKINRIRRKI